MKKMTNVLLLVTALAATNVLQAQQIGTIGVGDIVYTAASNDKLPPTENTISSFSSAINTALLNTRKFTVLNYAQLQSRLQRQNRTLDGYYTKQYTGNAVNQVGLDYILRANVVEFGVFKQQRGAVENTIGVMDVDFELIGVADKTDTFEASLTTQYTARVVNGDAEAQQAVINKVVEQSVAQLVDKVISTLFPIRLVNISDEGAVTLNYGAGLLQKGDTILVYPKDAEIVIDDTGDVIGDSIATLQVIDTERKFAIAQPLEGANNLKKGQKGQLVLSSN